MWFIVNSRGWLDAYTLAIDAYVYDVYTELAKALTNIQVYITNVDSSSSIRRFSDGEAEEYFFALYQLLFRSSVFRLEWSNRVSAENQFGSDQFGWKSVFALH